MSEIISQLCLEVCEEFQSLGIKKDIDPRTLKESYNIFKRQNGLWYKITKPALHESAIESLIDFNFMPNLKRLVGLIEEMDSEISKKGGRIIITETVVSKIKKGSESPVLIGEEINSTGPYRKHCDELANFGLEKDRYRSEETYMLMKTANGEWSMSMGHENLSSEKRILNLTMLPLLKILAAKMAKADSQFQTNGGRVFITPSRIYRLKNKIEVDFKF